MEAVGERNGVSKAAIGTFLLEQGDVPGRAIVGAAFLALLFS